MKDKTNGELSDSTEEAQEILAAHLEQLYGKHKEHKQDGNVLNRAEKHEGRKGKIDMGEMNKNIEEAEVIRAIGRLKKGKAMGCDEIANEFLIEGMDILVVPLVKWFQMMWGDEEVPSEWQKLRIHIIHKAGSKQDPDNYRGIAISSNLSKIFTQILRERIEEEIQEKGVLGQIKHGFRKGFRCVDALFILSQMIENQRKGRKKLYIGFLDIR